MAYKKLICCVSLMALMAPVSALQAQTTPQASEDEGGLGDIIVTARKVEENLQDVPVSADILDQERIGAIPRDEFGVDLLLAHAAADELSVLAAVVEYGDDLVVHEGGLYHR